MGVQAPGGRKLKKVLVYSGAFHNVNRYTLTINVAGTLPDVYKKLTKDNFFVRKTSVYLTINTSPHNITWYSAITYDPNSGNLTLSRYDGQDADGAGGAWQVVNYGEVYAIY